MKELASAEGMRLDSWLKKLVARNVQFETAEEETIRLEWLRAAAKEGVDAIERGEYTRLNSPEELDDFIDHVYEEVKRNIPAERRLG